MEKIKLIAVGTDRTVSVEFTTHRAEIKKDGIGTGVFRTTFRPTTASTKSTGNATFRKSYDFAPIGLAVFGADGAKIGATKVAAAVEDGATIYTLSVGTRSYTLSVLPKEEHFRLSMSVREDAPKASTVESGEKVTKAVVADLLG